jgi:hypothetical protein
LSFYVDKGNKLDESKINGNDIVDYLQHSDKNYIKNYICGDYKINSSSYNNNENYNSFNQ